MKKVISGNILKEKMNFAINLLCNTVKSTLGPRGSNAIIDHSTFSPFITNDGVTIAENIASDDVLINTILELAKESSIKTNEVVGDGTTTTLVYLQSIFNNGLKAIKQGYNPIVLKGELFSCLDVILNSLNNYSKIPSLEELKAIATISANDINIGNIIYDTYIKILNRNSICIKEGDSLETKVNFLKGYILDDPLASPYFLSEEKELIFNDIKILIINRHLEALDEIANIINDIIKEKDNLIIIANSYNDYVIEEVINLNTTYDIKIILLTPSLYGMRKNEVLKDLVAISQAKIVKKETNITKDYLGQVVNVRLTKDEAVFSFEYNESIKKRISELTKLKDSSDDKKFIIKRLTMFEKGSATILVGGLTKLERREKKMRFDDALWAISEASKGITYGEGLTPFIISDNLYSNTMGEKILKEALKEPLKVILKNAGLDENIIIKEIQNNNYKILYNVKTNEYEKIANTNVIDPTSVIKEAISNATSIAAMLLTTENLIINEYQNNLNKINEFEDI